MSLRSLILLFLAGFLIGCGAGPDKEDPAPPLSCDVLSLAASSAQPLDSVAVSGLPAGPDRLLVAEMHVPGDSLGGYAELARDEATRWQLVVPPHPSGRLAGGPVALRISDGRSTCPVGPFTIEPLSKAPGTFAVVVDGLERLIAAQAGLLGATPADLKTANPDRVASPLVPLMIVQAAIEHPRNPNSLRRILAGQAPAFGNRTPDLTLVEALWAKAGLPDALAARADTLQHLEPLSDGAFERARSGATLKGDARPPRRQSSRGVFRTVSFSSASPHRDEAPSASPLTAAMCPGPDSFYEPNAAELNGLMNLALHGDIASSGRAKKIFDAFEFTLKVGSNLPVPVAREGFRSAAFGATLYMHVMEGYAKLLPRRLTDLTFDLGKPVFMEDDAEPGSWENARLTARSEGWKLDKKVIEELTKLGIGKVAGSLAEGFKNQTVQDLYTEALGTLLTDASKAITDRAKDLNVITLGPCSFGPADLPSGWRDVKYTGPAVQVVLETEGRKYEPIGVGTSQITISTPPKKFGFQLARARKAIEVKPIRIVFEPPSSTVDPGASVRFMAAVENAKDGGLRFDVSAGEVYEAEQYVPGFWRIRVRTPAEPDPFPIRLKAVSTADRSHLRVAKERSSEARISTERMSILPASACVRPGKTQRFTIDQPDENLGGVILPSDSEDNRDYRWRASSGSISAKGVFTAPEANGTATITATSRENPKLRGEVEIRHGEQCNSRFAYTTAGDLTLQREDQFYGLSGMPNSSGRCLLELWFKPFSPAANSLDHTIHFRAVLPDGLREGSYPIGRNYTGTVGPNRVLLNESMKLATAAPGTFFGSFSAKKEHGTDPSPEGFLSENGTLTVQTFDGKQLEATFSLQMIESDPEAILDELGAQRGKKPRRSITVEGRLIHTVRSGAMGTGGVIDNYRCALPASSSSPASQ